MNSREFCTLDSDHDFVITEIGKRCEEDSRVPEFFQLIQPTGNIFLDGNRIVSNADKIDIKQDIGDESPGIASITELKAYPDIVATALQNAQSRVYLDAFPEADLFQCVIDNSIFLWSITPGRLKETTIITLGEHDLITATAVGVINRKVFTESITNIFVFATENSINIVPMAKSEIFEHARISTTTSFIITSLSVSKTDEDPIIFAGSNSGDIYGVNYKLKESDGTTPEIKIKNMSSNIIVAYLPKIFRFTYPIIRLVYDSTTNYVAALDSNSNIRFFIYKDKKLKSVYTYQAQVEDILTNEKEKIISLDPVPISDSTTTRFVSFTETGNRLFFGTNPGVFETNETIQRLQKKYGPEEFLEKPFIGGNYSLTVSVGLCEGRVIIMKPVYPPLSPVKNPDEYLVAYKLHTTALNFVRADHKYSDLSLPLFYHEMMWQYISEAPVGYILCTNGYFEVKFNRPVDSFRELLDKYRGNFSEPIRRWMTHSNGGAESSATAVLLAVQNKEKQRWALFILNQFARLSAKTRDEFDKSFSPPCQAFILCATRLLAIIWQTPIFTKKGEKWQLSKIYSNLPKDFLSNIQRLIDISKDYLIIRRASTEQNNQEQQLEASNEAALLQKVNIYLKSVIETIKFIKIVQEERKIITVSMQDVTDSARERLDTLPFGCENQSPSLFDALREFAASLLKSARHLARRLEAECPTFFSYADLQLIDITNRLQSTMNEKPTTLLEKTRETYIKYISQPFKLETICNLFARYNYYKGIIDIALKRAAVLDPMQHALQWYRSGRRSDNIQGKTFFDKRYECYEMIFDIKDEQTAFEMMLGSSDELFHVCLYHRIVSEGNIDRLLSLSTPFLVSYLEEYAPNHLWIYNARHKDRAASALQLLKMVDEDKQASLDQRVTWLTHIIAFAKSADMNDVRIETQRRLKCAQVQKELYERLQDKGNTLLGQQQLNNMCCENGFWDLALNIVSCIPIAGGNERRVISSFWANMLTEQLWNEDMAIASQRIAKAVDGIDPNNEIMDPHIVMPVLEEHRLRKKGNELWALSTMLLAKMNPTYILHAYLDHIESPSLQEQIKCDYIYSVAKLLDSDADPRGRELLPIRDWFIQHGKTCSYYEAASRYLKNCITDK